MTDTEYMQIALDEAQKAYHEGHAALCYHRAMPNVRRRHYECPHPASDLRCSQSPLWRY